MNDVATRKPVIYRCCECGNEGDPKLLTKPYVHGSWTCANIDCDPPKGDDGLTEKAKKHVEKFK